MFSTLYYSIFPALGQTFGLISSVALSPTSQFIKFLSGTASLQYSNLFTGEVLTAYTPTFLIPHNWLTSLLSLLLPYNDMPVFASILIFSVGIFLLTIALKLVIKTLFFAIG